MLTAAKSKEDEQNSRIRDLRKRTLEVKERECITKELLPRRTDGKARFSLKEKRILGEMPNRVMRNYFFLM
jgi:hypothetical protein